MQICRKMKNWHEKSKPFKEFDVISQNEFLHLESIPYQPQTVLFGNMNLEGTVIWELYQNICICWKLFVSLPQSSLKNQDSNKIFYCLQLPRRLKSWKKVLCYSCRTVCPHVGKTFSYGTYPLNNFFPNSGSTFLGKFE